MQFGVSTQLILHSTLSTSAFKRLDWASPNCVHQHTLSLPPFAMMFEELKTGPEISSDLVVSAFPAKVTKSFSNMAGRSLIQTFKSSLCMAHFRLPRGRGRQWNMVHVFHARRWEILSTLASALLRGFASNPIDIEENMAGHLAAAKCWPQDGFSPRL